MCDDDIGFTDLVDQCVVRQEPKPREASGHILRVSNLSADYGSQLSYLHLFIYGFEEALEPPRVCPCEHEDAIVQ